MFEWRRLCAWRHNAVASRDSSERNKPYRAFVSIIYLGSQPIYARRIRFVQLVYRNTGTVC